MYLNTVFFLNYKQQGTGRTIVTYILV